MAALGEMAAGLAHEINNPLSIIVGLVEQIRRFEFSTLHGATPPAVILDRLKSTVFRISKIVNGLLSFSRDSSDVPAESVELGALLDDTLELCRERLKHHGIELRVGSVPGGLVIQARRSQISQVLVNLLNNSYDAVVGLSSPWICIEVNEDGNGVGISVTDSGSGISAQIREKMMFPFFTTKPVGKGTGLGLSISKGIVEKHGGTLTVDPTCAHTRFVVWLPRAIGADGVSRLA
jgi:C4-dicarboxylate-specific signal transduction histidine kinase